MAKHPNRRAKEWQTPDIWLSGHLVIWLLHCSIAKSNDQMTKYADCGSAIAAGGA
jgi:hypothetical protein